MQELSLFLTIKGMILSNIVKDLENANLLLPQYYSLDLRMAHRRINNTNIKLQC